MKKRLQIIVFLLITVLECHAQSTIAESNREMLNNMQAEFHEFVSGIKESLNQLGYKTLDIPISKMVNKIQSPEVFPIALEEKKEIHVEKHEMVVETEGIAAANLPDIYPVVNEPVITSLYGNRSDPFSGRLAFHKGIDIAVKQGSDILTTGNGTVIKVASDWAKGNYIIIDHENSYQSYYGHLSRILVKKGDAVFKGQIIGKSGNTGLSTGPHIHYGILINGKFINPLSIIN